MQATLAAIVTFLLLAFPALATETCCYCYCRNSSTPALKTPGKDIKVINNQKPVMVDETCSQVCSRECGQTPTNVQTKQGACMATTPGKATDLNSELVAHVLWSLRVGNSTVWSNMGNDIFKDEQLRRVLLGPQNESRLGNTDQDRAKKVLGESSLSELIVATQRALEQCRMLHPEADVKKMMLFAANENNREMWANFLANRDVNTMQSYEAIRRAFRDHQGHVQYPAVIACYPNWKVREFIDALGPVPAPLPKIPDRDRKGSPQ